MASFRELKILNKGKIMSLDEVFCDIVNFVERGEKFSIRKDNNKEIEFVFTLLGNKYKLYSKKDYLLLSEDTNTIWSVVNFRKFLTFKSKTTVTYNGTQISFDDSFFKNTLTENLYKHIKNFIFNIRSGKRGRNG